MWVVSPAVHDSKKFTSGYVKDHYRLLYMLNYLFERDAWLNMNKNREHMKTRAQGYATLLIIMTVLQVTQNIFSYR